MHFCLLSLCFLFQNELFLKKQRNIRWNHHNGIDVENEMLEICFEAYHIQTTVPGCRLFRFLTDD